MARRAHGSAPPKPEIDDQREGEKQFGKRGAEGGGGGAAESGMVRKVYPAAPRPTSRYGAAARCVAGMPRLMTASMA